ncbi:MarR family winged helix-turn-helix transcriptional regulator [Streptomyces sp. NPDC056244]|uniref:MarR family winged helix-turn-helix transcriptional regulator n=1 Tax=Streptomyces sp. NPDC056244 TaxID=3345762 RepID=UPI0035E118CA
MADHPEPRGGPQDADASAGPNDASAVAGDTSADAVTHAVLAASRLLVAVSARSLAAVEEHAGERVTLPQYRLLAVLAAHGDAKLVEVADRLGVNPSTAMRMLDRLIAAGLASRQSNPDNRRVTMLRLTPAGRELVEEVTAARHREIAAIVGRLTPAQRTALVRALTAFTEAGGERTVRGEDTEPYPLGWSDTHAGHGPRARHGP